MMYEMTDIVCSILPEDKPRYLMGVGTPTESFRKHFFRN